MKVQAFQLMFRMQHEQWVPVDAALNALAEEYARVNLEKPVNFTDFKHTWVACEIDKEGIPLRALGLLCMVLRPDFPVCRFTDNAAVVKLVERANDYLHDQGLRGAEVMVHIASNELPEQRCPNYLDWMTIFEMTPADRYNFKIR